MMLSRRRRFRALIPPVTISSDDGSQFDSIIFQCLVKLIGFKRTGTTVRYMVASIMVDGWPRSPKAFIFPDKHRERIRNSAYFYSSKWPKAASHFQKPSRKRSRFCRGNKIKTPLQPPYEGPYHIISHPSNEYLVLDINGKGQLVDWSCLVLTYWKFQFQPRIYNRRPVQLQRLHSGCNMISHRIFEFQTDSEMTPNASWSPIGKEGHILSCYFVTRSLKAEKCGDLTTVSKLNLSEY